jgi:hypothetical protein
MHTAALLPETCVTNASGYAAMDLQPLKKIFDLMVSPRPGDEKLLSGNMRSFVAEEKIFKPKPGIRVQA